MNKFVLKCIKCGKIYDQNKFNQLCDDHNSLLQTDYFNKKFVVSNEENIWKYKSWLPCINNYVDGESPFTYKSIHFSKYLNLSNLYISFNGYWPKMGSKSKTCSFKDLEAVPTIQMLLDLHVDKKKILVVASAGNTARAFLYVCIKYNYPLIVIIPKDSINKIWIPNNIINCNKKQYPIIIAIDGDYTTAINISKALIESSSNYISEGGANNVARRDGMGTIILDATRKIGKLPDYYIQAVGSGTGGIASFEASKRIINDGNFGKKLPKLYLIQQIPCSPLLKLSQDIPININCPNKIIDNVLFNRNPPYSVFGGVKNILENSNGELIGVTKKDAEIAKSTFEYLENIDISDASSVSVAGIIKLVNNHTIKNSDIVLLNITSGGVLEYQKYNKITILKPNLLINPNKKIEDIIKLINNYVKKIGIIYE